MSRCNPLIAALLASAALAAPASARSTDTVLDGIPNPVQDLRSPDTRDVAEGRTPEVVVVRVPRSAPVATASSDGIDWASAGAGAGGLVVLASVVLATATVRRRRTAIAS